MRSIFILLLITAIVACKREQISEVTNIPYTYFCAPVGKGVNYDTKGPAPFFEGLTDRNFPISTSFPEAQKYFNQGMMLAFGFNHAEAARSFLYATKLDPDCAMCYWGLSYALGPNYNAGMEPEVLADANRALKKAMALVSLSTDKENALIDALEFRYPSENVEDRTEYDRMYSESMKKVHEQFPEDNDIAVLYAESIMDLHPWDLYDENSQPKEWTLEIKEVLEKIIANEPNHPAANHLYIHAVEASTTPAQGLKSADKLRQLVPGSGHLVHMPSHIYIRTGRYHEGSLANIRAVKVDSHYVNACHAAGVYPLAYYPHNFHFLAATAAMEGNGDLAIQAADRMVAKLDTNIMRQDGFGTIQHYYSIPLYIRIKFQKWNEILATKKPAEDLLYPQAIWHYARGLALVGQNDFSAAEKELESVKRLSKSPEVAKITVWGLNNCSELVKIASLVLEAKISERKNKFENAVQLYETAINIEDGLTYNEPPDWFFSVRHEMASALIQAGELDEAIQILNEDLIKLPENGWALHYLEKCYELKGMQKEAQLAKQRFEKAWQYSDFEI